MTKALVLAAALAASSACADDSDFDARRRAMVEEIFASRDGLSTGWIPDHRHECGVRDDGRGIAASGMT